MHRIWGKMAAVATSSMKHSFQLLPLLEEREKKREKILLVDTCSRKSVHFSLRVFFVYLSKAGLFDPAERPLSPAYDELPASSSLN